MKKGEVYSLIDSVYINNLIVVQKLQKLILYDALYSFTK
ncbi:hypothetical protein bpmyx0001_16770 [Bacillus pseudomycoides DSM 12442]|nr:hypothetical protein bmyco0002_16090 [Bacillus pseudomycoides]EEM17452.1 hypothetical protein bpmyx0001_16770 [Bacillus pseudomycoides DSM 12442]